MLTCDIKALEKHREETIQEAYDLVKKYGKVAVVRPTGYGKTLIMKRLHDSLPGRKLIFVPQDAIEQYMENLIPDSKTMLKSLYQGLLKFDNKEDIRDYFGKNVRCIFFDEAHRLGAEKWGEKIDLLLEAYPKAKIIGLTATPIRSDGKDILEEYFDDIQVKPLNLVEAIAVNLMIRPTYVSALYNFKTEIDSYILRVTNSSLPTEKKNHIIGLLEKKELEFSKTLNVSNILRKYLLNHEAYNTNMKFIVFCSDIAFVEERIDEVGDWFRDAFPEKRVNVYKVYSRGISPSARRKEIDAFSEIKGNNDIDIILTVNMFNEGVHLENVLGVICLRATASNIIYFQQIGRALKAKCKYKPIIFDFINNHSRLKGAYTDEIEKTIKTKLANGEKIDGLEDIKEDILTDREFSREFRQRYLDIHDEVQDIVDALEGIMSDNGMLTEEVREEIKTYAKNFGRGQRVTLKAVMNKYGIDKTTAKWLLAEERKDTEAASEVREYLQEGKLTFADIAKRVRWRGKSVQVSFVARVARTHSRRYWYDKEGNPQSLGVQAREEVVTVAEEQNLWPELARRAIAQDLAVVQDIRRKKGTVTEDQVIKALKRILTNIER